MLTKQKAVKITRELWNWVADNPKEEKINWPGWKKYKIESECDCVCCDYAVNALMQKHNNCSEVCPLLWPNGAGCIYDNGLFSQWENATIENRSELARQIANLPERPDKEFDIL